MKRFTIVIVSLLFLVMGNSVSAKDRIKKWSGHVAPVDETVLLPEVLKQLKASYPEHVNRLIAIRLLDFDTRGVEKDVLGRPLKQRLTIWTAYESDEKPGHALVVQNKCFTYTPLPEVPLKNCFQPDSLEHAYLDEHKHFHWFTPLDQLPDQSQYGLGGSTGGTGFMARLILAASLLISGSLLAVSMLNKKIPSVRNVMAKLIPIRSIIGVTAVGIGVVFLIFGLLSPFDDIVPLVALIIAGLMLGIELLIKKSREATLNNETADQAVNKVHDVLVSNQDKITRLENKQIPIGLTCIALSVIHLLFGSMMFL